MSVYWDLACTHHQERCAAFAENTGRAQTTHPVWRLNMKLKLHDGNRFELTQDEYPDDPRNWHNLGVMVCFHKRYRLGDTNHGYNVTDFSNWRELREQIEKDHDPLVILPLWMLDHSGMQVAAGEADPFRHDYMGLDSGQIGFIFVSKAKAKQEFGEPTYDRVKQVLLGEIETYNQFLQGDVWSYCIRRTCSECGTANVVEDTCGGFFGRNPVTNGMLNHIPEKYHAEIKAHFGETE